MSSVASQAGLIHLGMDTPKNMIVVAMLFPGAENPVTERVANEEAAIRRASRFADRSVPRCWYEAGPGGYELWRLLASMEVACQVVAPSLIPEGARTRSRRPAGFAAAGPAGPGRGADAGAGPWPGRGGGAGPGAGRGPRSWMTAGGRSSSWARC
jgi:hypothetical protein